METIRLLFSLVVQIKWLIYQIDVKSIFLNGAFEKDVHVEHMLGYMKFGKESQVLKLKKEFYDLRQMSRAWNNRMDTYFKKKKNSYNVLMSMHCI